MVSITSAGKHMENIVGDTSLPSEDVGVPSFSHVLAGVNDSMVGFKKEIDIITKRLVGDEKELKVISIVGMPGIGKTTLAMNLFKSYCVVRHFDKLARGVVSQNFVKQGLILNILSQVKDLSSVDVSQLDEEALADMLCKSLKKRRYLIVIDDVWDIDVWNYVKRYLPDDKQGSRVLITTRNNSIASDIGSEVHILGLLGEDESWELFQKCFSKKENLSGNLLKIAKTISDGCKGLPLSIVVIAGVLSHVEKSEASWNQISKSMNLHILADPQFNCKTILDTSFNNLPHHLQTCLLYLGRFAEDKEISVSRLAWMWLAEGFVQDTKSKSSEDVAKDYIMDLLVRNLVILSKERSEGGVKTFHLHDLIRDFCVEKAKGGQHVPRVSELENLSSIQLTSNPPGANHNRLSSCNVRSMILFSDEDKDKIIKLINSKEVAGVAQRKFYTQNILCTSLQRKFEQKFDISTILGISVQRKFDIQNILGTSAQRKFDIENILGTSVQQKFDTQNILGTTERQKFDIHNILFTSDNLAPLVGLRYLEIWISVTNFSLSSMPSITTLQNLQTLIIETFYSIFDDAVKVPDSIWDLVKLRHLHVRNRASFELDILRIQNNPSLLLEDLRSLSKPKLSHDDLEWLRRLPKLQKLSCIVSETWDDCLKCHRLPEMDFLSQLTSLKVELQIESKWDMRGCNFHLPLRLKKLTLRNFLLNLDDVSKIGKKLQLLQVLKLYESGSDEIDVWRVSDEDFPELKVLKLADVRFNEWTSSDDAFPSLEKLWLENCSDLEAIPLEFGDIPMLRLISVRNCKASVDSSAKAIEKIQHEGQNEKLEVHIYPKRAQGDSCIYIVAGDEMRNWKYSYIYSDKTFSRVEE